MKRKKVGPPYSVGNLESEINKLSTEIITRPRKLKVNGTQFYFSTIYQFDLIII